MDDIPLELKKKIANVYLKNKTNLEDLHPNTLEAFASELLEMMRNGRQRQVELTSDLGHRVPRLDG